MDPGPSDPSLLQLQSTHRSTRTWRGEVYETMRVRRRRGVVDLTMRYHSRMIPYLRSSGFYEISRVAFFGLDWALINAFVERWRPETHTFHMHCGECTITLQDVQVQLGLPIEGMPVTGTTDADYADVCERLLGRTPGGDDVVGCKLKVDWLERHIPAIDDDSDEESVQRYVRSYILQLIGGCLFADESNRFVHLMFLTLLKDFQVAGQYSWGVLVWLICIGSCVADLAQGHTRLLARQFFYNFGHGTDFRS
ncbi:hypothetical protein Syun_027471 [Stephania yunnanensis]|uniref:Aminotransferase-like plant mobile domain-containing protein n=1 Tax=Stephania yunnanensis TaxID=152371 RepID=A0AAP0EFN5_9MAGN